MDTLLILCNKVVQYVSVEMKMKLRNISYYAALATKVYAKFISARYLK